MKRLALLAAAVLALTGCASQDPPVSDKVQAYYDEHVANAQATLPARADAKTVAFIGDAYTSGSGASSPSLQWRTQPSSSAGWAEVNVGRGGRGYLITNTTDAGEFRPNYAEMIAEAVKAKPDVVVISDGGNDMALSIRDVHAA